MSDEMLRDLVVRMATDPEFAERVRSDPGGVAAEHGLTVEQVGALAQLGDGGGAGGPSMLDARLSKSSLFFGGGMHADPHGLLPTPFHPQGSDAHDPAGFLCDGCEPAPGQGADLHPTGFFCDGAEPAPVAVGPAHADPAGLLCNGFQPTGMGDGSVHPAGFFGDGHASHGIAGPDHAIAGPDHPAGVPSAAAPISLLTGKVVAPIDSHGAGVGATADTHAAGPGGGPVSQGIIGPDKAHGIVGPDRVHGIVGPDHAIVGPDKPQIVGPDIPAGAEHATPTATHVPTTYVQATAPPPEPHAVQCNG